MSLFSLIDQSQIHLAPDQLIIKSDDFQKILTLKEIQEKALKDIERFKKDAVLQIEKAKEVAEEEGFQAGLEKWATELSRIEEEIKKTREEFEKAVLRTAILAAQKFVGRELQQTPETMVDIVKTSLKSVVQHKRISIYCNNKDFQVLEQARGDLKAMFEELEVLGVYIRDNIPQGGYVIETERGIINHSDIDKVWTTLEEVLGNALKQSQSNPPKEARA
jgi:type III secretion protein L